MVTHVSGREIDPTCIKHLFHRNLKWQYKIALLYVEQHNICNRIPIWDGLERGDP